MSEPASGLPAREAALVVIQAALARRGGLEAGLAEPALARLAERDRGFARALALTALRRLGSIDLALAGRLTREPPPRVRGILRLGLAQAWFLETPAFAAVSTSVALAGGHRESRPFKGLVNATLRRLIEAGPPLDDPAAFAPPWLLARWIAAYGREAALAICATIGEEPATDLTPRDSGEAAALAADLDADLIEGGSLRLSRGGDPSAWPGFAEGRWWVQDVAAAIPARLLAVRSGETALDMCAAPGGKTMQLAAAGAQVTALDRAAQRLIRVQANLDRTGLKAGLIAADALTWGEGRLFDAVLLDAPCSATGTFRRHPDVLWAARPGDVAALARSQSDLLSAAAERTRPGGRLVYSVCSLEPEEGEAQVDAFLARRPDFALDPAKAGEGGAPAASLRPDGTVRLLPPQRPGGQDGFFVARFRRRR